MQLALLTATGIREGGSLYPQYHMADWGELSCSDSRERVFTGTPVNSVYLTVLSRLGAGPTFWRTTIEKGKGQFSHPPWAVGAQGRGALVIVIITVS